VGQRLDWQVLPFLKTQFSFRIDNEVLDWLKSKGEGHLTRINEMLRERMIMEQRER